MKKFNVTFKENKRYNPNTRTIMVETINAISAENLIISEFGSWSLVENQYVPSKRISILKVEEIKE